MSKAHVFIVNEKTFPYHLKYRFVGTTAGEGKKQHVGLLADMARIRKGDKVIFYLQNVGFFGIYEICSEYPFYVPPDGYLQKELGVPLIYRAMIRPDKVYPLPISEWEAIDKLPERSRDINWSLIYRKLKGERGCSYLLPHEYKNIACLLHSKNKENKQKYLTNLENKIVVYDSNKKSVKVDDGTNSCEYKGETTEVKSHFGKLTTEAQLQAWLTYYIGRHENLSSIFPSDDLTWFANEVYAGVGMQRIDLLCIWQRNNFREFGIYELKSQEIGDSDLEGSIDQIRRYIWWVDSYVREPQDKVKIVWISKGWYVSEQNSVKLDELLEQEKERGLATIEVWEWGQDNEQQPTFELVTRKP